MQQNIGKTIARLRRERTLTQDQLAEQFGISPQAVSKWENDLACPDVSLLPLIADFFSISLDELFGRPPAPVVAQLPPQQRTDSRERMLRITVDCEDNDTVRVNLPVTLVKVGMQMGIGLPQLSGQESLEHLDFEKLLLMVEQGVIGRLVEVTDSAGNLVAIEVI